MSGYKGWTGGEPVDWDKVDSGSPTPLERGIYNAVITKAEPSETKNGKPALMIEMSAIEKYESDEEVSRKLFDTYTMTQQGVFKVKQLCEATDIEPPETTGYEDVHEFGLAMLDVEVWVLVGVRTFEGKTRNRVEFYIAAADVAEVYAREFGGAQGGKRALSGARATRSSGESSGKKTRSRKRRASPAAEEGTAEGTEEGTEEITDSPPEGEAPRRARRRRRPQAEQG